MKNLLKIILKRAHLYNRPNAYYTEVNITNSLKTEDIVDELVKEGLVENREWALELLRNFNSKTAQNLLNGNDIDTGLVVLSPNTTAIVYEKNWNPSHHDIGVTFTKGVDLRNAIANTRVEIAMNIEDNELVSEEVSKVSTSSNDSPPCGQAFRNWILQTSY